MKIAHSSCPTFLAFILWLTKCQGVGWLSICNGRQSRTGNATMNELILQEISKFCRQRGLAESTFGRRAANDGKLASRLRNGGRITTDTLERIRAFMARSADAAPPRRRMLFDAPPAATLPLVAPPAPPVASGQAGDEPH